MAGAQSTGKGLVRDKAANLSRGQVTKSSSCHGKEGLHLRKTPGKVWRMD